MASPIEFYGALRFPVVTLGIIGICVVVQLLFQFAEIPTQREAAAFDDAFDRLVVFWEQHTDLAIPEDYDWGIEFRSMKPSR